MKRTKVVTCRGGGIQNEAFPQPTQSGSLWEILLPGSAPPGFTDKLLLELVDLVRGQESAKD